MFFWQALCLFLCLCSCFSSEERFRSRGQHLIEEMTHLLQTISNHEELEEASGQLKRQFKKLAALLVEIREFRKNHPEVIWKGEPLAEAEKLFIELARLYEIPGCREIIERVQVDAVYLLLPSS